VIPQLTGSGKYMRLYEDDRDLVGDLMLSTDEADRLSIAYENCRQHPSGHRRHCHQQPEPHLPSLLTSGTQSFLSGYRHQWPVGHECSRYTVSHETDMAFGSLLLLVSPDCLRCHSLLQLPGNGYECDVINL